MINLRFRKNCKNSKNINKIYLLIDTQINQKLIMLNCKNSEMN